MTDKKRFTRARLEGTSKIHSAVNLRIQNLEVTGNQETRRRGRRRRLPFHARKPMVKQGIRFTPGFGVEEMPIPYLLWIR